MEDCQKVPEDVRGMALLAIGGPKRKKGKIGGSLRDHGGTYNFCRIFIFNDKRFASIKHARNS